MSNPARNFTDEEVVILFEAARIALADGEVFDRIVEQMDISDDEMLVLREKLETEMADEKKTHGEEDEE